MERPLDAGPVVIAEVADAGDDVLQVVLADLPVQQDALAARAEAGLGSSTQVHDDLDDIDDVWQCPDGIADLGRQGLQQGGHVVGGLASGRFSHGSSMSPVRSGWTSAVRCRQQCRLGHANERLFQEQ